MGAVVLPLPSDWAGSVVLDLPDKTDIHASVMPEVLRVMRKGAQVSITHHDKSVDTKAWVDRLVFAGFVDVKDTQTANGTWDATACKPVWDAGAAVPLSLKKKQKQTAKAAVPAKKVWTISADDDDDLIDEDTLVEEEELRAAAKPAADDCEMAEGRKACKNCSCGRAEAEAAGATDAAPTSACGSCYLGDGFRCAGCPYRGMPPFKPGEKVTID